MRRLRLPNHNTKENAFTLIELIVVVLIIGILTAIAVPSFEIQRRNNTDTDTQSAARALRQAADELHLENASHPNSRVTMEAILSTHANILKHANPGTVLAIQSVDAPTAGYCITASNPNGNDFTQDHPYVLDTLGIPVIMTANTDNGSGACPAGVKKAGTQKADLPNQYVVNADQTITPVATVNVCGAIKPGSIKQDAVRHDGGNGTYTPVSVDLLLSSDCSRVTGTIRVTNADKGDPNAVYTLPIYTQTINPAGNPITVANAAYITITGVGSAQVNLATGLAAGQDMKSVYFDYDYRTQSLGEAYLLWQQ